MWTHTHQQSTAQLLLSKTHKVRILVHHLHKARVEPGLPKCLPPTSKAAKSSFSPNQDHMVAHLAEYLTKVQQINNCIILPSALFIIFPICFMLGSCTMMVLYKGFLNFFDCLIVPQALCMCTTLGEYSCPMDEFNITTLHFVFFHNVTCSTNSLLSQIHVNTTKTL